MGVGGQRAVLDATPAAAHQHIFICAALCRGCLVHRSLFIQCPSHTGKVKFI